MHGDDPRHRRAHQSVLTIADTRFGTRGAREEEGLGTPPRVLAIGVFDDTATPPTLLHGPTWTGLHFLEQLDMSRDRRTLDLRGGVLFRELPAEPVPLRTLRFASLARPGCFGMRAEGAVDWLERATRSLPATDGTFLRTQHGDLSRAQTETGAGGLIAATMVQRVRNASGRRVVERLAFYAADPDGRPAMDRAKAGLAEADRLGFEALLTEHRTAWARRWDDALVSIDGDPEVQLAVRFSLFQLMASVPTDGEAAVGARGVSGPSYRGHVLSGDADVFALPFFAATCPPAARVMLEYRLRRLGPAYRAAAERELQGLRDLPVAVCRHRRGRHAQGGHAAAGASDPDLHGRARRAHRGGRRLGGVAVRGVDR